MRSQDVLEILDWDAVDAQKEKVSSPSSTSEIRLCGLDGTRHAMKVGPHSLQFARHFLHCEPHLADEKTTIRKQKMARGHFEAPSKPRRTRHARTFGRVLFLLSCASRVKDSCMDRLRLTQLVRAC